MKDQTLAFEILGRGYKGELREGEPLSRHVSLRTGGQAALFAVAQSVEDLRIAMDCLSGRKVPWIILGGGTNVVFTNGGFSGCVLRLGARFGRISDEGEGTLVAGAAAQLPGLVSRLAEDGLSGLECLAGIPGTVGGAVFMNAGTRSGEIADAVHEVQIFDGKSTRWIPSAEMGFSYRSSGVAPGQIILGARFKLNPSTREEVRSKIKAQVDHRAGTQPSGHPSAGCWFRNPEGDSAGRLIENAGMKGEKYGAAQVSEVHANFLINLGGATTSDFLALAERVRQAVYQRYGIDLQEEVRIVNG